MRLVIATVPFSPSVGGVETVSILLAKAFANLGHEVKVITATDGSGDSPGPFTLQRQPSMLALLKSYFWSEGVVLMGDGIRLGWPALLGFRPFLVTHHMYFDRLQRGQGLGGVLRKMLRVRGRNLAPSQAVAKSLDVCATVVANPYDDQAFSSRTEGDREREIVFVGRLIAEKGPMLILQAAARLHQQGMTCKVTMVGDGPLRTELKAFADEKGLKDSVVFVKNAQGVMLADLLSRHRVMVVPSICEEAFGIVALEGIASGCVVVGSQSGGLPEAVGPCGVIVPKNDAESLAREIGNLLTDTDRRNSFQVHVSSHLSTHYPEVVAKKYLEALFPSSLENPKVLKDLTGQDGK